MSNYDKQYLDLVKEILDEGIETPCRTGNNTLVKLNKVLTHDMKDGFPILTFRGGIPFKGMKAELSCFLRGVTSKKEFVKLGCNYWNQWCNPKKVPAGLSDEERKAFQLKEDELGNIYGFNYRHFSAAYVGCDADYTGKGFDQLADVVERLKKNPYDRRMIISAWDPANMETQALPPCMYLFQFSYLGGRLHLSAKMRSTDLILGCPTDMCFCALLLAVMSQTVNMTPGTIDLSMTNCHIYDNHIDNVKENLHVWDNVQYELPTLVLDSSATVFNFMPEMASLSGYSHGEKVSFPIAV